MQNRIMWILGLAGLIICATAAAAVQPVASVDVRNLMTVTEFDHAGLNKLSPGEIKALNVWLNQYLQSRTQISGTPPAVRNTGTPAAASSGVARFGVETMAPTETVRAPNRIETRIAGRFTGWTGETLFKLENGQEWEQAATGYFTNVNLDHPRVVIKRLAFGYLLTLPGHGETVFVRRIK